MTMSFILVVGLVSVLMIFPITLLSILFSLQSQQHQNQQINTSNTSNIFQFYLTFSHLSSFWKLLLHHSISPDSSRTVKIPVAGVSRQVAGDESDECCVCLCKIEIEEEIRELKCRHVFHVSCLEAWIGTGRATCPLCRRQVTTPAEDDGGAQVLFFRFSTFRDEGQDNWWIR